MKPPPGPGSGRAAAAGLPDTRSDTSDSATRLRLAACELCDDAVALRYRVQHGQDRVWRLVCPACQARVADDNPHYRYGGTWKAKRRRA